MQKGCKPVCFAGKMLCTYQQLPLFPKYCPPVFLKKKPPKKTPKHHHSFCFLEPESPRQPPLENSSFFKLHCAHSLLHPLHTSPLSGLQQNEFLHKGNMKSSILLQTNVFSESMLKYYSSSFKVR